MKARQHLAVQMFLLFLIVLFEIFFSKGKIYNFLFNLIDNNFLIFFLGVVLYFLGAILPDSDSEDRSSRIYYTIFFPIAYIVNLLEYPLSKISRRNRGHRQSLHTITGIALSSFIVALILYLLYSWLISNISFLIFLFWFFCLFISQFLHLLEDLQEGWRFEWI